MKLYYFVLFLGASGCFSNVYATIEETEKMRQRLNLVMPLAINECSNEAGVEGVESSEFLNGYFRFAWENNENQTKLDISMDGIHSTTKTTSGNGEELENSQKSLKLSNCLVEKLSPLLPLNVVKEDAGVWSWSGYVTVERLYPVSDGLIFWVDKEIHKCRKEETGYVIEIKHGNYEIISRLIVSSFMERKKLNMYVNFKANGCSKPIDRILMKNSTS